MMAHLALLLFANVLDGRKCGSQNFGPLDVLQRAGRAPSDAKHTHQRLKIILILLKQAFSRERSQHSRFLQVEDA
jgi:hypothetical protein